MLKRLTLGAPNVGDSASELWFLQPVIDAARAGLSLVPAMAEAVRRLGFDSFMYALATEPRCDRTATAHVWTTLPDEWVDEYDCNGYIDDDPRLALARGRTTPLLWDAATIEASGRGRHFLDRAARYGIRSGVMVMFNDASGARIVAGFHSATSPVDSNRRMAIAERLGSLMMATAEFHDLFVVPAFAGTLHPVWLGPPLSPRERQCLELAAHGMTSADIGIKLDICERTVHFHIGNVLVKLGVLNRQEAIALALTMGLIRLDPFARPAGGTVPASMVIRADVPAAKLALNQAPRIERAPVRAQTRSRSQSRSAPTVCTSAAGFISASPSEGWAP